MIFLTIAHPTVKEAEAGKLPDQPVRPQLLFTDQDRLNDQRQNPKRLHNRMEMKIHGEISRLIKKIRKVSSKITTMDLSGQ